MSYMIPAAPASWSSLDPFLVPVAAGIAGGVFIMRIRRLLRLMRAVGGRARVVQGTVSAWIATLANEVLLHGRMFRVRGIGTAHWLFQYSSKLRETSATTGPAAKTSRSAKSASPRISK